METTPEAQFEAWLDQANLSQTDAARFLGVSCATVSRIVSKERSPSLALARRIFVWTKGQVNFLGGL